MDSGSPDPIAKLSTQARAQFTPVKILPLKCLLATLSPDYPSAGCQSSVGGRTIRDSSSEGYREHPPPKIGVTTTIPSSSFRSTIEKTPTLDSFILSPPSTRSASSSDRIPSIDSMIEPAPQSPFPFVPRPPPYLSPFSHYSSPFPHLSRPSSEIAWFSRFQSTPPSSRRNGAGCAGGGRENPYDSSSTRCSPFDFPSPQPSNGTSRYTPPSGLFARSINPFHDSRALGTKRPRSESSAAIDPLDLTLPAQAKRSTSQTHQNRYIESRRSPATRPTGGPSGSHLTSRPLTDRTAQPDRHPPRVTRSRPTLEKGTFNVKRSSQGVSVALTLWEDQVAIVLSVEVNGSLIARRLDNDWINCTKLLNALGLSRGKRDSLLKAESNRIIFRKGPAPLKGVFLPFDSARRLAQQFDDGEAQLYPLFEPNFVTWAYSPTNRVRTRDFVRAARGSSVLQAGDDGLSEVLAETERPDNLARTALEQAMREAKLEALRQRRTMVLHSLAEIELGLGTRSLRAVEPSPQVALQQATSRVCLSSIQELPHVEVEEEEDEKEEDAEEEKSSIERTAQNRPSLPAGRPLSADRSDFRCGQNPSTVSFVRPRQPSASPSKTPAVPDQRRRNRLGVTDPRSEEKDFSRLSAESKHRSPSASQDSESPSKTPSTSRPENVRALPSSCSDTTLRARSSSAATFVLPRRHESNLSTARSASRSPSSHLLSPSHSPTVIEPLRPSTMGGGTARTLERNYPLLVNVHRGVTSCPVVPEQHAEEIDPRRRKRRKLEELEDEEEESQSSRSEAEIAAKQTDTPRSGKSKTRPPVRTRRI